MIRLIRKRKKQSSKHSKHTQYCSKYFNVLKRFVPVLYCISSHHLCCMQYILYMSITVKADSEC